MRWKVSLTMVLITIINVKGVMAQSDPRLPTNRSDPLKLLVDKLNDPQHGADLRAKWNVDRAVWVEPVTAIRDGVTVLITPAHPDIHTSIDNAGAVWSRNGPLISAPHNPTSARVFIPRGYPDQGGRRRLVSFAPGGGSTEYSFEPAYAVRSPVLRRGYVLCVINAWSNVATPIPLAQWGPRLNEIVVFTLLRLSPVGDVASAVEKMSILARWHASLGGLLRYYSRAA